MTVETSFQVRTSVQGYLAGDALPARSNCWKDFLIPLLHRYEGEISGRERAMPHIKLFCAHQDKTPLWVLLSSFNLSRAAFGETLKNGKFRIRSYELGVLFLPKADGEDIRTLETNGEPEAFSVYSSLFSLLFVFFFTFFFLFWCVFNSPLRFYGPDSAHSVFSAAAALWLQG